MEQVIKVLCVCACVYIGGNRITDYFVLRIVKGFMNHLFAETLPLFPLRGGVFDNDILII